MLYGPHFELSVDLQLNEFGEKKSKIYLVTNRIFRTLRREI